jgi:hypothetical protein
VRCAQSARTFVAYYAIVVRATPVSSAPSRGEPPTRGAIWTFSSSWKSPCRWGSAISALEELQEEIAKIVGRPVHVVELTGSSPDEEEIRHEAAPL